MVGEALAAGAAGLPLQSHGAIKYPGLHSVKFGNLYGLYSIFEDPGVRLCRSMHDERCAGLSDSGGMLTIIEIPFHQLSTPCTVNLGA